MALSVPLSSHADEASFDAQIAVWQQELAHELECGKLWFPQVLDSSFSIEQVARDNGAASSRLHDFVHTHSALCHKVMKISRLPLFGGTPFAAGSLADAIDRVGMPAIRCLAFAVAAEELIEGEEDFTLRHLACDHWKHASEVAANACVLGRYYGDRGQGCDLLAGLLMNIAEFFLLDRIEPYPAFSQSLPRFAEAVVALRHPIRNEILAALDAPAGIAAVLTEQRQQALAHWPPQSLREILMVAKLCAAEPNPFDRLVGQGLPAPEKVFGEGVCQSADLKRLIRTINAERQPLIAALRN